MPDDAVLAITPWPTNADLIADLHRLDYLNDDQLILDPTYGLGNFYTIYRPANLHTSDIDPDSPADDVADFTDLPWEDGAFDAVVLDPPYKLNGTPDPYLDARYGVDKPVRWQDRMELILAGAVECARVVKVGGLLLIKCQDQVCSGEVRWQTDDITDIITLSRPNMQRWRKKDRLEFVSYRPQPAGRRQLHARHNSSTMLVFQRIA